jgi:hypothetical protein
MTALRITWARILCGALNAFFILYNVYWHFLFWWKYGEGSHSFGSITLGPFHAREVTARMVLANGLLSTLIYCLCAITIDRILLRKYRVAAVIVYAIMIYSAHYFFHTYRE